MATKLQEQLKSASIEINDLKASLRQKENAYQDLERDCKFHAIKAAELADIVNAVKNRSDDEVTERLKVKSLQNVELTVQVEALRSALNQTTKRMENLKQQKNAHQQMLLELSGVVRSIQKFPIAFDSSMEPTSPTKDPRERPLHDVKMKVQVIERRWRALIQESSYLRRDNASKNSKIKALEALFHNLNSDRITHLQEQVPPGIEFGNDSTKTSSSTTNPFDGEDVFLADWNNGGEIMCQSEVSAGEDGSTEIVLRPFHSDHDDEAEERSVSSSKSSYRDELEKKMVELVLANYNFNKLKDEHAITVAKLSALGAELAESNTNYESAKKKQDLREGLLRDLIAQYKELQKDYDDAMAKVSSLEDENMKADASVTCPEDDIEESQTPDTTDDNAKPTQSEDTSCKNTTKDEGSTNQEVDAPGVETGSTFELSESSSSPGQNVSSTGAQAQDAASIEGMEFEFEHTTEDYKKLEDECLRLEHEYDNAVANMANLERELELARLETEDAKKVSRKYEIEINSLHEQQKLLEEEHKSTLETTELIESQLEMMREQAEAAQVRQNERNGQLWQVVNQYKTLAEEHASAEAKIVSVQEELLLTQKQNETAEAKIAIVQEELLLTQKQTRRRNLVHEYRKMEHDLEDARLKVESLEQELKNAKAQVSRTKEEAKGTRKRLAGCHFHYKKLQQQYDEALASSTCSDRELKASRSEVASMKAHEDAWTDKLMHIRQSRAAAMEENLRLRQENDQLKTICAELRVQVEGDRQ